MALSPDVMRQRIKGVVIVQATPFNNDGSLDIPGLKANTQFLVERCKGGRFILVPTGQHRRVLRTLERRTGEGHRNRN